MARSLLNNLQLQVPHALASQVFKTAFWMRKHLAVTWTRTWIWSTSPSVRNLDLGPLLPSEKATTVKTTRRWTNKDGKKKWQGTRNLKGTQYFACTIELDKLCCSRDARLALIVVSCMSMRQYTWRFASNVVQLFAGFGEERHFESLPPVPRSPSWSK